jgi:hypothetical protein
VGSFDISADGSRIVYPAFSLRSNIFRIDFDPEGNTPPRESQVTRGSTSIVDFNVSNDGQWLVYRSGGHQEDIYLARADGTETRKLTDDLHRDRGAAWSYDGRAVYFYSDRSGRYEFWSISPDGGGLTQITQTAGDSWWYPRPAPEGARLIGHNEHGTVLLDLANLPVDPANGSRLPDIDDTRRPRLLAWSPDGTHLAGLPIARDEENLAGVLVYSLESERYQVFAESVGQTPMAVDWLSDNRRLLAICDTSLLLIDTATGETRKLYDVGEDTFMLNVVDDNKAYFTRSNVGADIWMAMLETP